MPRAVRPVVAVLSLALALAPSRAAAQSVDSLPSCSDDLDGLQQRTETNYAGFRLEITGERRAAYDSVLAALRVRASAASGASCYFVLRDFTAWFDDPHLFVYQSGRLDTAETARRAAAVEVTALDETAVRRALDRRRSRLDPIEGIWYEGPLRLGVVPDPSGAAGRFVAVVLTPDTTIWRPGAVRARFTRRADGGYDAQVSARNYVLRQLDARIHRRTMLRLSPGIWGKVYPVLPADSGQLDPLDVHRPTLRVRGGTVVVSLPSHDPAFKRVLDSLVAAHAADLTSADRLIVDLRGNEGGSSFMSNALLPYIRSEPARPDTVLVDGAAVMMSSPDQMAYARRAFGSDTSAFVRSLLARMTAHPGELVPLEDPDAPPDPPGAEPVVRGPRRVGLLIDRGTVSASEVLVLAALRSTRADVFGEPTMGAFDYQSVNVVPVLPRERRWYLGYPTITRNTTLPRGGMRGHGIAPTVPLALGRLDDPLAEVERRLMRP